MKQFQVRILDANYVRDVASKILSTSEDPEFPASNLGSDIRSEVARTSPNGYFKIDSSNDYIDFKESAIGSEISVQLTHGEYTGVTLAAEIKSKMEGSTGVSATYTVSKSLNTGLWTISTDQAYLALLWSSGTNQANSVGSDLGYDTSSDQVDISCVGSRIAIHSSHGERFTVDLADPYYVDSVGIFAPVAKGMRLSSQAVVKLQANDWPDWSSPPVDITLTLSERWEVFRHYFESRVKYRYWSILIIDPSNPDLHIELGSVALGEATQLSIIPRRGFSYTKTDRSEIQVNEYGHEYSDVYPTLRQIEFNYNALTYADVKKLDLIYDRVGRTVPIMLSIDPLDHLLDSDHMTVWCKFESDHAPSQNIAKYFEQTLTFREIG